jgi:glycosyltransferase involved in cell wall biosynthesis
MLSVFSENDLEVLIATQNRNNFDFLLKMFPFEHFSNFNLVIINQTKDRFLKSDYDSVKVINVEEKGLSKSRNSAIQKASKKICLITDDDVIFDENFHKNIISAFQTNPDSAIITFNHYRIGDAKPQKSWHDAFEHNFKSIWNVSSIEIAFLLDDIKGKDIRFDENFGLGSFFETAEEFLFLRSALEQKLKVSFCSKVIVSHPEFSSGKMEGSDSLLYARAALFYKIYGDIVYIWLVKYLFFLIRKKYIKNTEILDKWRIACDGISKFKQITKNN